jgi:excisionase family DNA binding protein
MMKKTQPIPDPTIEMTPILTAQNVAEYLRVHTSTIYRLLKNNQLPAFRIGSDWRFDRRDIDRWRADAEHSQMPINQRTRQ